MRRLTLFIWLLFDAVTLYHANEQKLCSTSDAENGCPKATLCSEFHNDNSTAGQCVCENATLSFNPNFTNEDDYCIDVKSTNANNDTVSNETNKKDTNGPNAASSSSNGPLPSDDSGNSAKPLPGTHHIIAGILIPIFFVFIVIGSVFVYKKLHITHRVRNIRRTRRNRPFYEDVMLGNNDNDDPPLI